MTDIDLSGNMQKGSLEIMGVVVELLTRERPGLEFVLRVQNPEIPDKCYEIAAPSLKAATEWKNYIEEAAQNASARVIII